MLEINPPCCRLMDMGSHNGTHVNDQRVSVTDLKDGDKIRAGANILYGNRPWFRPRDTSDWSSPNQP